MAELQRKDVAVWSWRYDAAQDALIMRYEVGKPVARTIEVGTGIAVEYAADGTAVGTITNRASTLWPKRHLDLLRGPQFTIAAAAAKYKRSPATIRAQIRNGRIEAQKIGRDWMVWEADMDRYMASLGPTGGRPAGYRPSKQKRRGK